LPEAGDDRAAEQGGIRLGGLAGTLLGGRIADRMGLVRALQAGMALMIPAPIALRMCPGPSPALSGVTPGLGVSGLFAPAFGIIADARGIAEVFTVMCFVRVLALLPAPAAPATAGTLVAGEVSQVPLRRARTLCLVQILLVSGSTRAFSGNTAALRTVQAVAAEGIAADLYDGLAALPAFNPDDDRDPLPEPVRDLRQRIAAADAILFCVPEYAGTLPGSLKNLLDWTVGGGEIGGKRAAWINVAAGGRGGGAQEHLAMVLGYVGAIVVDAACVQLPVPRDAVQDDGTITDPAIRAGLAEVLAALARSVSGS
jgi:NAD(P)H-dependent FMN reductase